MDDLFREDGKRQSVDYFELARKFLYRTKIVLRAHWWIVPAAVSLGIAFKAVEGYLKDPYFLSTAEMIVSGRINLPENDVYDEEGDNFYGTQIELMRSGQVRTRAMERVRLTHPEVHEAFVATEAYQEEGADTIIVEAVLKNNTDIFELYAYTPHPEYTRLFLDAVMEEYINRRIEMRSKTSERTYESVQAEVEELRGEIRAHEDAIVDFQKENNIVFIREQGSAAGEYLTELERRLAELETENRALGALLEAEDVENLIMDELQTAEAGSAGPPSGSLLGALGSEEDNLKYLEARKELDELKAELEEFSIYLKPKHPKIIGLKDQVERMENQLKIFRRQSLERVRERRAVVQSRIRNLKEEIDIWEQSALENGRLIAEYERLQARLERAKAAYESNENALRAIESSQSKQPETVSVLTEARPPVPAGAGTVRRYAEGTAYGLFLAGGILFIVGLLDNRILTANEVNTLFEEPLLGAIPFQRDIDDGDRPEDLLRKDDERHVFAEACRNLRTSVFFMGEDGSRPSVLAITSAVPSEGKSTVSANLAVALSFSRSKVLLVDADLRRGRLHKLFGIERDRGLAEVLQGECSFEEAVHHTSDRHLDVLTTGEYPAQPAELLLSERMNEMIARARETYDFVIFDTAPILATDDTTSFAGQTDGVLFTIRCAHTQLRQVRPALKRLKERSIHVSGLILNCVDTSQPGYYYYRYSEYYTNPKGTRSEAADSVSA